MTTALALTIVPAKATDGVISDDLIIPDRREFPLSPTTEPCDDFYQYVCSEEVEAFTLPVDKSRWTFAFSDSAERITRAKSQYLKTLSVSKKPLRVEVQQMASTYKACMNQEALKKDELQHIQKIKKELSKIKTREKLKKYLSEAITYPLRFSFVDFGDINNLDNPLYNDLYIDTDFLSLPHRSYYDKKEIETDYIRLVDDFFKIYSSGSGALSNTPSDTSSVSPQAWGRSFFELEKAFAQVYPLPEEWREILTQRNTITQEQLLQQYPNLKLEKLLRKIPESALVRHFIPESYAHVNRLLDEQPLELLKAFVAYKTLAGLIDQSYPDYFKKKFEFQNKHLGGPATRASLEKRCTQLVEGRFGKELDHELIGILFPNFDEERFVSLLQRVKQSVIQGIEKNTWLSPESKKGALEKMAKLEFQVVKPKEAADWDFQLVRHYTSTSPFKNTATFSSMMIQKTLKRISEKNRKTVWSMSPLTVNAYYSPPENKFVMPIGILQPPFYDESLSDEANLGAVGVVVGHEIGHGLDDKGSKYDGDGKLRQWMSDEDIEKFKSRGQSLGRFYEAYGMIPALTMGENIGDLTGLQFSYNAAFPNGAKTIESQRAFFIQYARVWCERILPKEYERRVKTGPHSQLPARVNAPIPHLDGFYEAFSCRPGQNMYVPKEERVVIW